MDGFYGESNINIKAEKPGWFQINDAKDGSERKNALASLFKGELISGTVMSVGRDISLNICGQEVKAPSELLRGAVPGETLIFEVMSITDQLVELKRAGQDSTQNQKSFMAVLRLDADRKLLQSRKDHEGKQAEREKKYQGAKSKMEEINSRITGQDYRTLEEEGFPVEELTVGGLSAALTRIKNQRGPHKTGGEGNTPEQKVSGKRGRGPSITDKGIKERLKEANLPVNNESVQRVKNALNLSEAVPNTDEQAMKNLIRQELPPTIANLYKVQFLNAAPVNNQTLPETAWKELLPQVKEILEEAGYEINTENLGHARWLVENGLPLNGDNLAYISSMEELEQYTDKEVVLYKIIAEMGNGTAPEDVLLLPGYKVPADKILKDLQSIKEETIHQAIRENKEITINELTKLQGSGIQADKAQVDILQADKARQAELTKEQQYEVIHAQRLLEEIRLKMTSEAAIRLEKQGFHIETKRLEEVVENLRRLEDSCYRDLFTEADTAADSDSIQILKTTTLSMEQLKVTPSYVLGITLTGRKLQTIPTLLASGDKLAAELSKAKEAYESLMTVPNREYGDSIKKAFKNTDFMLKEMGMENTVYNQRAIRILGYNQMEISEKAIDQVKAYDIEVNTLIKNLHPAVTVRLIKEGINPMDLPVSELNTKIEELKQEMGISEEEKFSNYLRKLDKEEKLPEKERKAYIGIYRLLHNIEKTDGAALGAVIKSDQAVTLEHLLTAVRTLHKGRMDTVVDDHFGALQSITSEGETITDQIKPAFEENSNSDHSTLQTQDAAATIGEQVEFMNSILKQMAEELTPDKLMDTQQSISASYITYVQTQTAPLLSSDLSVWETLKSVPLESLYDQFMSAGSEGNPEDPVYEEKVNEMRETMKNADQAVRFLDDFKVPCTTVNLVAAGQILSNGGTLFKKLFRLKEENKSNKEENELKETGELADKLIDSQSMEEAYKELETEVKELIGNEIQAERIDSKRLAELKSLGIQMSMAKTLAEREFYQIPLETKSGITNVNLTILRGTGVSGKVAVTVYSEKLGKVKAELSLKDKTLNGLIVCDSRNGLAILDGQMGAMEESLKEENIEIKHMDLCLQPRGNDNYIYQNKGTGSTEGNSSRETERLLYRIATVMVLTVRAAETAGEEGSAAASWNESY